MHPNHHSDIAHFIGTGVRSDLGVGKAYMYPGPGEYEAEQDTRMDPRIRIAGTFGTSKKDTKIKLKKSNTTNSNKISAHEKLEGGIKQVIAANNVIGAMASEEELRAKAANSGVRVSPFHPHERLLSELIYKLFELTSNFFAT